MERALYLHVKSLSPFTLFMADKIWPYTVISAALDQRCCYFTKIRKNGFLPCFQMMKKVHLFFNIIFHILRTSHKSSECGLGFTSSEQINAINSHLYAKAALRQQQNGWALTHTQLPPEIPHSAENSTLACIRQVGEVNSFFFLTRSGHMGPDTGFIHPSTDYTTNWTVHEYENTERKTLHAKSFIH